MMEMRKFIVTLHEDGSMSWNEYEEPGEVGYTDVARKCRRRIESLVNDTSKGGYESGLYVAYRVIADYCEEHVK